MKLRYILLTIITILASGCSRLNSPYYVKGDYSYLDNTIRSGNMPVYYKKGGRTTLARHRVTMKKYVINGKVYYPTYVGIGDTMTGVASWYGPSFHKHQTSNGEFYNMYAKTMAHKTWPMDTMVKITNLNNGKSTIARINDRGPFVSGRVVDCSYRVAKKIGIHKKGTCRVRLEVVGFGGKVYKLRDKKAISKIKLTNFGVQIGAFTILANAKATRVKFLPLVDSSKRVVIKKGLSKDGITILHRVQVMGFSSREEALDFISDNNIANRLIIRN